MPPGESSTVDTLRSSFGWSATRVLDPGQPPSFGGEAYDVEVPQHCGDTMTRGVVGCASSRGAVVDMWFSPPDGRRAKFKIIDFHEVVKSGAVNGSDGHLQVRLPASSYELRAYTSAAVLPYERVRFDVVPCLRTRLTCTGVTFTNPADFPDYTVVYTFGSNPSTSIRLGSEKSKKVSTSAKSMRWEALPRFEELPELWTIHAGEGEPSCLRTAPTSVMIRTGSRHRWPWTGAGCGCAASPGQLGTPGGSPQATYTGRQ